MSGWWFEPLWKILVNWDGYSHIREDKKCSKPPTRCLLLQSEALHAAVTQRSKNPAQLLSQIPTLRAGRATFLAAETSICSWKSMFAATKSMFFTAEKPMGFLPWSLSAGWHRPSWYRATWQPRHLPPKIIKTIWFSSGFEVAHYHWIWNIG